MKSGDDGEGNEEEEMLIITDEKAAKCRRRPERLCICIFLFCFFRLGFPNRVRVFVGR